MKKISYKFFLILFLFTAIILQTNLYTQVTEEWVRYFNSGGTNGDDVTAMALDTSGNVIVTGTIHTTNQNTNFCTVKYNPAGVLQWSAIYNGPGSNSIDNAVAVGVDKKNNIYVAGNSESTGFLTDDYCVVKYSSSGVQLWVARYNGTANGVDDPNSIAVDKFGNVYVTGQSEQVNGWDDWLTVKYDSSGIFQWAKYYNGPTNNEDVATSIVLDDSCNVYVGGDRRGASSFETTVIKYSSNGTQQWIAINSMSNRNYFGNCLTIDKFQNIYIAGDERISGNGNYYVIKYSSNGVQQWLSRYTTPTSSNDPFAIAIDSNLNVLVTGYSYENNNRGYCTVKYNNSGVQQWVQIYNGVGNSYDEVHGICVDTQGNIYITGISINTENDFVTIKYSSNGVQQWIMSKQGGGVSIAVDKNFNVFVSGSSLGNGLDYTVIKYNQPTGIIHKSNNLPVEFILYQNYPNPFNPSTTIEYELPKKSYTILSIYDILGRKIEELVNNVQEPGIYSVIFNADKYSSGIYFYKLTARQTGSSADDFSDTKKMLLIK